MARTYSKGSNVGTGSGSGSGVHKLYDIVTEKLVSAMESGVCPWRKPWKGCNLPEQNAQTGRAYRGINSFLLPMAGYSDPRWVTFKQALDMGGNVRKGEKGSLIVFWRSSWERFETSDSGERAKVRVDAPVLSYSTVFNAAQCDGLGLPSLGEGFANHDRVKAAEALRAGYADGPEYREIVSGSAYYTPATDSVTMPLLGQFETVDDYYSTLFHELAHSTGHPSRLARRAEGEVRAFGSDPYAKEELIAEMASAMLCAVAGIDRVIPNSAAYLAGWIKALKGSPKLALSAAGSAQKAADWIRGERSGPVEVATVADLAGVA